MATSVAASSNTPIVENMEDDDDVSIDEEQLQEYQEMVENLGEFPDKVKINSLSMVAEDHSDSKVGATALYQVIRHRLLKSPREKLLPLVYVVDSIVKNAKGHYVSLVEEDAANWIPTVYELLQEPQKQKLQKVWKTWNDVKLFSPDSLKAMGRCFDEKVSGKALSSSTAQVAGISRTKDGSLLLPKALREEMHNILDDLQSDVPEVDKVSLERLANVNPSLLENIKETAQQNMQSSPGRRDGKLAATTPQKNDERPAFLADLRSPEMIQRSMAWKEHEKNVLTEAAAVTQALREGAEQSYKDRYTQGEAIEMTQVIATASVVATFLAQAVERINQDELAGRHQLAVSGQATQVLGRPSGVQLDPTLFTNEGVKQRNMAVVALLYEVGLPFLSSADGRRFRTQLELSKHLDALFKRTQLEKSMTRAEERGWYLTDAAWQRKVEEAAPSADVSNTDTEAVLTEDGYDPEKSTMPADENHDRCTICGLNFKMFFDNDNGIYMYKNCRGMEVLNDEVALDDSENMLVHVTCWRALGSPEVLTMDQALQDTVRH